MSDLAKCLSEGLRALTIDMKKLKTLFNLEILVIAEVDQIGEEKSRIGRTYVVKYNLSAVRSLISVNLYRMPRLRIARDLIWSMWGENVSLSS